MSEPLISIIIPAYNAEQTLERTVSGIQSEIDNKICYEILIVENGSSDKTSQIAQKLVCENVSAFHSEKGVSNARNYGIERAKGQWLMFVDADDTLLPGTIILLNEVVNKKNVDLFLFGHKVNDKTKLVSEKRILYSGDLIEQLWVQMLNEPTKYLQVWAKIFKREIVVKNKIQFDMKLRLAEDSDFTLQYLKYCKSIELHPECIYDYTVDNISTIRSYDGQKVNDYARAMEITQKKLSDESAKINDAYWGYVLTHFHVAMVNEVFSRYNTKSFAQKKLDMKKASEMLIFQQAIQETKKHKYLRINRILGTLLRNKMYFAAALIYEIRAWQKKTKQVVAYE